LLRRHHADGVRAPGGPHGAAAHGVRVHRDAREGGPPRPPVRAVDARLHDPVAVAVPVPAGRHLRLLGALRTVGADGDLLGAVRRVVRHPACGRPALRCVAAADQHADRLRAGPAVPDGAPLGRGAAVAGRDVGAGAGRGDVGVLRAASGPVVRDGDVPADGLGHSRRCRSHPEPPRPGGRIVTTTQPNVTQRRGRARLTPVPRRETPREEDLMKKMIAAITLLVGVVMATTACEVPAEEPTPVQGAAEGGESGKAKAEDVPVRVSAKPAKFRPGPLNSGGAYTCVRATVTNRTDKNLEVNPFYFELTDTGDRKRAAAVGEAEGEFELMKLAPGEKASGGVCAEGDFTPKTVTFTKDGFGTAYRAAVTR